MAAAAFVGLGEDWLARRGCRDNADVLASDTLEADVDDSGGGHGEAVVE